MFEHWCPSVLVCCITCVPAGLREVSVSVYPITAVRSRSSGPMLKDVIRLQPQESYSVSQGNIYCRTHSQWEALCKETHFSVATDKEISSKQLLRVMLQNDLNHCDIVKG